MMKTRMMVYLGMLVSVMLHGIQPIDLQIIREFPFGSASNELGYVTQGVSSEPHMPESLAALSNGSLYILDNLNDRVVLVDEKGLWEATMPGNRFAFQIEVNDEDLYVLFVSEYEIYNLNDRTLRYSGIATDVPVGIPKFRNSVLTGDMLFINTYASLNDKSPVYYGMYVGDAEVEHRYQFMAPEETREFIETEYDGEEDLRFDDNGYLFWGGRLVAPHGRSFAMYHWETNRPTRENAWIADIMAGTLIGWDRDGNTYWSTQDLLLVISPSGELLKHFRTTNVNRYGHTQFTMTEDGTLYVLSLNDELEQFELMKLERFW